MLRRLVVGLEADAVERGEGDLRLGLPRVGADLPLVRSPGAVVDARNCVERVAERRGVGRRRPSARRSSRPSTPASNAAVSSGELADAAGELPQGVARLGRVDVADAGDELHRRSSDRRSPRRCRPGSPGRRAELLDDTVWLLNSLTQHRLGRPGAGQQGVVVERRRGPGGSPRKRDRLVLLGVDLRPRRRRHHPAEVVEDLRHQLGAVVVGVRHVRRHVGVVAEERQVELLDGDDRAAHALHAHARQVDVHVAAEEPVDVLAGPGRAPRGRSSPGGRSPRASRGRCPAPT